MDNIKEKTNLKLVKKTISKKQLLVLLILFAFIILVIYVTVEKDFFIKDDPFNNQRKTVVNGARDITYLFNGDEVNNFSTDINESRCISSRVFDVDNDKEDELLQISIRRENSKIYPVLEVVKASSNEQPNKTESVLYDFSDAKFYISTFKESEYYLYRSDKFTYVLLENDVPVDNVKRFAAGIIGENNSSYYSFSFAHYPDGSKECYDLYNDEVYFSAEAEPKSDIIRTYELTELGYTRIIFYDLGLKDYLINDTDVDNISTIEKESEIALIGKFSVIIDGEKGEIIYSDVLNNG